MEPLIRAVRPDDAAAIYEIRRQPEVQKFTTAMPSERPQDFIGRLGPNDHILVAELDGRVVGVAGLHGKEGKHRHVAWLGIAVHDAFAGRGAGRALLLALLDLADNWLNLVRVELEVFADNERAIAMYRRLGFEEEGRQRKAYFRGGQYIDAVLMARVR
jgi:L-phenylalanine/L-methionine N-acetyltransferase